MVVTKSSQGGPSVGAGSRSTTSSATNSPCCVLSSGSTHHQPAIRPPGTSAAPTDRPGRQDLVTRPVPGNLGQFRGRERGKKMGQGTVHAGLLDLPGPGRVGGPRRRQCPGPLAWRGHDRGTARVGACPAAREVRRPDRRGWRFGARRARAEPEGQGDPGGSRRHRARRTNLGRSCHRGCLPCDGSPKAAALSGRRLACLGQGCTEGARESLPARPRLAPPPGKKNLSGRQRPRPAAPHPAAGPVLRRREPHGGQGRPARRN
jgi:hypothetical protein